MWLTRTVYCLLLLLLETCSQASALIHQQVAFDNSDVCWWGFIPPDLVCPIISQQNLTELVNNITDSYAWEGGDSCEGVFCLYWNRGFAGGRGIAIITTPASYDRVKAVGELLREHDVSFKDLDSYPFHIAKIEGKGDGIVADQSLKRGDPIMGHTPVLVVHRAFKEALPQSQQQHLVQAAVDSLPPPTAELFMAQMAHIPEKHRDAAMLTTNAFLLNLKPDTDGDDGSGHHFGAFPEVAKLNHDCRPNAVYHIDSTTLMLITTAVRAIEPGEEITLSYTDPFAPRKDRHERLHKAWSFDCQCEQCSLPDEELEQSDTRLKEIKWIEEQLSDYQNEPRGISTGLITYLLGLYENEGLHCCLGKAYKLAAMNFNGLGYEKQAKMYAELAIEAFKLEKGGGTADIMDMETLIKKPNKHWTFSNRLVKIRS